MAITPDQARQLAGTAGVVHDHTGVVVGRIVSLLIDEDTGEPTWVSTTPDHPGAELDLPTLYVPLDAARISGTDITVPFSAAAIHGAPGVADPTSMSPAEEQALTSYYSSRPERDSGGPADVVAAEAATVVRSEERLQVRAVVRPRERVRLVKHVVTEYVTQTVAVRREEVRLEREPVDGVVEDGRDDAAGAGREPFAQDDVELVLHQERVVVSVEVVPVERVRLAVHTHSSRAQVTDDVRVERVELSTDGLGAS